jgi:hypothetical protein
MIFFKVLLKALYISKYRWASLEFKDGSVFWGSVTDETWKRLTKEVKGE